MWTTYGTAPYNYITLLVYILSERHRRVSYLNAPDQTGDILCPISDTTGRLLKANPAITIPNYDIARVEQNQRTFNI